MSDKITTQLRKIERIKTMGIDAITAASIYGLDSQTMWRRFLDNVKTIKNLRQWSRREALAFVKGYHEAFINANSELVYWLDGKKIKREEVPANENPSAWSRVICLTCWKQSGGIVYLGDDPEDQKKLSKSCPLYADQIKLCQKKL